MRQPRYQQTTGPLAVLDGGIGTGAISSAFCKSVDRPVHVYGIDLSTAMLKEAAARLCPVAETLTLSQADISDTPYADNTFDVVLVPHVFEHLADPSLALAERYRVLKPGGILICCITRRSSIGAYIQLIWRTNQVSTSLAKRWLHASGFQCVRPIPLPKRSAARRFSIRYVGQKPS